MHRSERDRPDGLREPGKRIEGDLQLLAELKLCDSYRISHSHFLGGPPTWTELDRQKAFALRAYQAEHVCPDCGTDPSLWTVSDEGVPTIPYVAHLEECGGCGAMESLRDQVSKDPDVAALHGVKIRLKPLQPLELVPGV